MSPFNVSAPACKPQLIYVVVVVVFVVVVVVIVFFCSVN